MYLLDTDVLIWLLRGHKEIKVRISDLKAKAPLAISVISIAEIYKNIFPSELIVTEEFLNKHIIFDVNPKIAKLSGLYWQQYRKKLINLSLSDCLIAATASSEDVTLVSMNIKHFPMRDIKVMKP